MRRLHSQPIVCDAETIVPVAETTNCVADTTVCGSQTTRFRTVTIVSEPGRVVSASDRHRSKPDTIRSEHYQNLMNQRRARLLLRPTSVEAGLTSVQAGHACCPDRGKHVRAGKIRFEDAQTFFRCGHDHLRNAHEFLCRRRDCVAPGESRRRGACGFPSTSQHNKPTERKQSCRIMYVF